MTADVLDPLGLGLAILPVVVLLGLVLSDRVSTRRAAIVSLGVTATVAAWHFQAPARTVGVALGKGAWLGVWILAVVWPALLLYRVAALGGLDQLGNAFTTLLRRREDRLLAMAWVLPSFVQGVAGFGTPIAVAAPILVALGWSPTRAIVYPLLGYHWSVTFGSMGSSFYMASLTSNLTGPAGEDLAVRAALLLGTNALIAPVVILLMDGGVAALRRGARLVVLAGVPMVATLVLVARAVPAVASLAAGTVGMLIVLLVIVLDRGRSSKPEAAEAVPRRALVPLVPYALLLVLALPVFLVPASRGWVSEHLTVAPSFPATATGLGWTTAANPQFTPLSLLGHPGSFILASVVLTMLWFRYRRTASAAALTEAGRAWARSLPNASASVLLLAMLALLMVDAGMIWTLATGIADLTGPAYPWLAPVVGALGSFMTGSTTSSNALFAALQGQVAGLIDVAPATLVAAQTAGGNVGNSVAPVVVLVGAGALGHEDVAGVLRRVIPAALGLLVVTSLGTQLLLRW